jgi:hypothetical protein
MINSCNTGSIYFSRILTDRLCQQTLSRQKMSISMTRLCNEVGREDDLTSSELV